MVLEKETFRNQNDAFVVMTHTILDLELKGL
jgi:hypothetical protein